MGLWTQELDELPLASRSVRKQRRDRTSRRCRRSCVSRHAKRIAWTSPILILAMFGVLHLLQFLIGRSRFFWNTIEFTSRPGIAIDFDPRDIENPTRGVLPIPCHSHNDYWRREPLFDALRWGCASVEADVFLFDQELYVGHTVSSLKKARTFRSMYVDPLVEILDNMNDRKDAVRETEDWNGVFSTKPEQTLVLLVDLKHEGHSAFDVLQRQLQPLRERNLLSYWNGQEVMQRAITVIGTGDTPFDLLIANTTHRDIFFDAPLDQLWEKPRTRIERQDPLHHLNSQMDYGRAMSLPLDTDSQHFDPSNFNTSNSYYASTSFSATVGFVWRGHLSPRQMEIIRGQIRGAKRRGLKARYWSTPRWPIALRNHIWHVLVKEGADILSVDDLAAAASQSWTSEEHLKQLW